MFHCLCVVAVLMLTFLSTAPAEIALLSIDGTARETWFSEPFDHKCLLDCTHELVKHSTRDGVSIKNRTCSVECHGKSSQQHRYRSESFERIQVHNPNTSQVSECLVGILVEDIFCAKVSLHFSGVRKLEIENNQQCQRRNYRYYLPYSKCREDEEQEFGEESCEAACIREEDVEYVVGQKTPRVAVDIERVRAKFRVCYDGRLSQSYHVQQRANNPRLGRFWHFCRASMTPCSLCFRWSNWTAQTSCSQTCGSTGTVTFHRRCEIKRNQENPLIPTTYKEVPEAYCKAYFGGLTSKTESCRSDVPCPAWAHWGPWSGCSNILPTPDQPPYTSSPKERSNGGKRKCNHSRKRRGAEAVDNDLPVNNRTKTQNGSRSHSNMSSKSQAALDSNNGKLVSHGSGKEVPFALKRRGEAAVETRTRKCIRFVRDGGSKCPGNSSQHRPCPSQVVTASSVKKKQDDDCEQESDTSTSAPMKVTAVTYGDARIGKSTQSSQTSKLGATTSFPVETVRSSHVRTRATTLTALRWNRTTSQKSVMGGKPRPNNNFTIADDGFTSVLADYAPALIAGLLVFIVVLLLALIGICGTRIMQKNRNTAYDVTSPSFSAGTVGSIPSGLVHGFSHTLGLRSGSGTFGRSISTINGAGVVNDAMSFRGSSKSVASTANSAKASATQQKRNGQMAAACKSVLAKASHQNSPRAFASYQHKHATAKMPDRKPSSSSLLSTASATGFPHPPVTSNSCSFQPLPPIPLNHSTDMPQGQNKTVFKRGTGRSSSLTPVEQENRSRPPRNQTRCESVGARVSARPYFSRDSSGRRENHSKDSYTASSKCRRMQDRPEHQDGAGYCKHTCGEVRCPGPRPGLSPENEYWSVTRRQHIDSGTESSDGRSTASNGARRKVERKVATRSKVSRAACAEEIPLTQVVSQAVSKANVESTKWFNGSKDVKMVDNVLYAVSAADPDLDNKAKNESIKNDECSGGAPSSGDDSATSQLETSDKLASGTKMAGHEKLRAAQSEPGSTFYDKLELEDSSKSSDVSTTNDDDYDHLCDQFGAPHISRSNTSHPGRMTSLHQLRQRSIEADNVLHQNTKPHDYECIEFEEDSQHKTVSEIQEEGRIDEDKVTDYLTGAHKSKVIHEYVNAHPCDCNSEDLASL